MEQEKIKEQATLEDLKEALSTIRFLWDNSAPDHSKTNWSDYFNIPANTIQRLEEKIRNIEAKLGVASTPPSVPNSETLVKEVAPTEEKYLGKMDHLLAECPTCGGKSYYNDVTDSFEFAIPNREGWVKVEDGLPEIRKEVLLFLNPYFSLGYRSDDENDPENHLGWVVNDGDCITNKITHWMPLPPPPSKSK